ncbi:germination protein XA [Brevibacillus reuszeri]|uniref:Ger(x)C family spore germination protein n=1 Tax=Brevibacillus reuszeri TaxID=54915 RepID=UPI001B1ADECB|nr:Ger(x)C family spore germination protein [Brevibacillus reuszeri]GIO05421.1 germination protein XA [Brevibacillus reuszeri]
MIVRLAAYMLVLIVGGTLLSGCSSEIERPSLEDMAFIGVIGFDYINEKDVKVSVSTPVPSRSKEKTQVYSTVATVMSEAMLKMSTKAERTMSLSQLRVILFNEEYARKVGIRKVVLDLYRNPSVGENAFVAIVKGNTEDLIRASYQNKPELNTYLNDLLRPRVETAFSSFTSIQDSVYMMTNEVSDMNLPYLVKEDDDIQITKVALFKDDKMIGSVSQREGKLIQALLARKRLPRMSFEFQDQSGKGSKTEQVVLDFVWSKSKVRSNGSLDHPIISMKLELRGMLVGYTGSKDLKSNKQLTQLKKQLESEIKKETQKLVQRLQKEGVDPASLEESLRQKYHGKWTRPIAMELYQKAGFNVTINMEVVGYGTIK